jgi:competence protein ComEC
MVYLLATVVTVFAASMMPLFISPAYLVAVLTILLFSSIFFAKLDLLLVSLVVGLMCGFHHGYKQFIRQLPDSLDKQEFLIRGSVIGLVQPQDQRLRFNFLINSAKLSDFKAGFNNVKLPSLNRVLLSWYGDHDLKKHIKTGTDWQFMVRLRKPRGMLNENGFDYQAWLFQQGISATGYIVESELNHSIAKLHCSLYCQIFNYANRLRGSVRQAIYSSDLKQRDKAVIAALTVGDKQGLSPWWNDLARFGIVHLMVISGLHIGLISGLGYWIGFLLNRVISFCATFCGPHIKPSKYFVLMAPIMALSIAVIYSFLAGFTLPTQRALIVVFLVMLPRIFYLPLRLDATFVWSLFLIALMQPLAVLGASFWLSFSAVMVLILYFSPRIFLGSKLAKIFTSQLVLFVGMAAPLVIFIGQVSWLSVLVNLFAVPVISLVTIPLCLLAGVMFFLLPSWADIIWQWASVSISALWSLLELMPKDWGLFNFAIPSSNILSIALMLAACCFIIPRGLVSRWLCILPLALLVVAYKPRPPLRLTVLDVGQGLAVVAEVGEKLLVYDTGPYYSSQFNAGSGVIAPYIKTRGLRAVDKLIISHGDMDHSGGFFGLNQSMDVKQNLLSPGYFDKVKNHSSLPNSILRCDSSRHWAWAYKSSFNEDVEWISFDVLMPFKVASKEKIPDDNNSSCVLLIRWRDRSILLSGDIEKSAEVELLKRYKLPDITVLVAPHHGSQTSSSQAFVDHLQPAHVVFSAGYRHHFGHPHSNVVNRYKVLGSELWNTAIDGGISFEWDDSGKLLIQTARGDGYQYWWR